MTLPLDQPLVILAAVLVAVFGVGRLTRVLTYDSFPPAAWIRAKWETVTADKASGRPGEWGKLATCFWCATPWIMLVCIGWGLLSSLHWSWWLFWGWLALSYLASIVIARDEP